MLASILGIRNDKFSYATAPDSAVFQTKSYDDLLTDMLLGPGAKKIVSELKESKDWEKIRQQQDPRIQYRLYDRTNIIDPTDITRQRLFLLCSVKIDKKHTAHRLFVARSGLLHEIIVRPGDQPSEEFLGSLLQLKPEADKEFPLKIDKAKN